MDQFYRRARWGGVFVFAVLALVCLPVHAATWTFKFSATVGEVSDSAGLLGVAINEGDVVTGVFVYNSTAQNVSTLLKVGSYDFHTGLGVIAKVDGLTFRTDPDHVNFHLELVSAAKNASGKATNTFLLHSYNNLALSSSVTLDDISWQLDDPNGKVTLGTTLSSTSLDLTKWESVFGLTFSGVDLSDPSHTYLVRAHVYEMVSVPNGTLP